MDKNAPRPNETRYDRSEPTPGLVAWVYEYWNREPKPQRIDLTTGLEIGVQLRGDWFLRRLGLDERTYAPGTFYQLSPAQRYSQAFSALHEPGLQVGFILYPNELPAWSRLDGELEFAPGAAQRDSQFVAFCRDFQEAHDRRRPLAGAEVSEAVRRFVERSLRLVPASPLLRAKREIDRHFDRPLYLAQLAERAGMRPTTFARRFARRFGVTPVHYRLMLRLNEAARLTWARTELTIAEIAARVGFEDLAYFHRAFARQFGRTPAAYGGRFDAP